MDVLFYFHDIALKCQPVFSVYWTRVVSARESVILEPNNGDCLIFYMKFVQVYTYGYIYDLIVLSMIIQSILSNMPS